MDIDFQILSWYYITIRYIACRYKRQERRAMKKKRTVDDHLPLTHTTYYILLALGSSLHGYGIMQKVEEMSKGTVRLGPGTLYGALSKLEKDGLIVKVDVQERKKNYQLTVLGNRVIQAEYERLHELVERSKPYVEKLGEDLT